MKNNKKILINLLVFITCINLISCSSDPIVPQLEIDMGQEDYFTKNVEFSSTAGEKTFSFSSNVDWNITTAPTMNGETWCTVSPNSGTAGKHTIRISVSENVAYDDRNVVLTLIAGQSLSKTITVTQKQKDALTLTTNKFELDPKGGEINVEIKSNVDYQIIIPDNCKDWISLSSKSRGLTTSTVSFNIAETDEYNKREGEIIIKDGNLSETVHVYQTGQEILLLTKNEYIVDNEGETIAVEVKSNFSFDVQMTNVDWVSDESKSRGLSSHTLYYKILPNETYDHRQTKIIFYDKKSSIKDTLKIIQLQKDAIILSQKEYDVKPGGEIIDVILNTNVTPKISIDCDWIKLVDKNESRGLLEHNLKFDILENTTDKKRSASISISNPSKSLTEVIQIHQEPVPVVKSIEILEAGTIAQLITETEKYHITDLTVKGEINGTDIKFIREMAGYDADGNETEGKLINLDLSMATIVEGGTNFLNHGATFWGFEYNDGNRAGQWVEDIFTSNNSAEYVFIGLKNLKTIILPSSLKHIGRNAFYGCHNLRDITIPQNVDSGVWYEMSFDACLSLEAIFVENGNKILISKNGALFQNTDNKLTLLAVPAALKTFTISVDVDDISWYAFPFGNSLEELIIQNGAAELKPYFYDRFYNLKKFVIDKKNLKHTTIDGVLYSKDQKTIECYPNGRETAIYEIPKGVIAIGDGCFNTSLNLQKIIIPEGIETIGSSAFFDCRYINKITLPSSVKTIGSAAFQHIKFKSFTCLAVEPPILQDENVFFYHNNLPIEKMFVPKESLEKYKNDPNWNSLAEHILAIEDE